MATLRNLGYKIATLIKNDSKKEEQICAKLGFSKTDLQKMEYGRLAVTPKQIKDISAVLSVKCEDLVSYKNNDCYKSYVHCMSSFSKQEHCDEILDIIDSYIDIKEAL